MASHTKKDDFCLECHWEAFHLDRKEADDSSEAHPAQWSCPDEEHPPPPPRCDVDKECPVDEECCDVDNCSLTCPSVCDGFVDCEEALVCSVSHCDDDHCKDTEPVCFDEHCFGPDGNTDGEHSLESLLGLGSPLNIETNDLLSSTAIPPAHGEPLKTATHPVTDLVASVPNDAFLTPYTASMSHCHTHSHQHFHCHDFTKDAHHMNSWLPVQNAVNPADVFHMMSVCPDLSGCHPLHTHQVQDCPGQEKPADSSSNPPTCFHIPHHPHHLHHSHHAHPQPHPPNEIKSPPHNHQATDHWKPCRTHVHRCRTHGHAHIHPYGPYSPYSRHSRSSVSSQLSPAETPPPLDGGASSVLTSPEYSPDTELYICRWTTKTNGVKTPCGAAFADSCGLQGHLVACHMGTVEGAKGLGYYCCWDGCHRPDEPFSQKSKLQGHFLTHSNYKNFKCTVCGKKFARQATLERHERSHRGEKPYKCPDCGKSFTDSSELKTHSRTHTGEKPFKCTYPGCNFQTGDSSNMSSHRLTHGERRHKCYYLGCTKSFTRHDQLKRHLKTTHKDDGTSLPSPVMETFGLAFPEVA
ncbi:hypothetical protein BO70DRAFT_144177 [Aspergillus heteromorphus CBS 117.55]|uniref:C2H2-type domain-containing protein n=1 Tax=Aspergillus heteromorphus CBS 117.55 TaxID=1448321 RepID=A0A317V5U8_9EURO|nr:uncharacterized protein BO70DRAFT_144177 [Aspergillus heteromorphus CBS 117.55]PWY69684.1 hypothetical protein BO70DRAFT_144177 [Aspergillus heteromorphus CBS 117.55]